MWRSILSGLLSCLVVFAVGEALSGWWVHKHGDALDLTKPILEQSVSIGWRQRTQLHTTFLGLPLETNEWGWRARPVADLERGTDVLVLGPSSTFGWGVSAEDTYAAQLEALLARPVANAGEIGYSTEQGVRLYADPALRTLHPRVVVIAYGVNDTDRYRFYYQSSATDADEFSKPHSAASARILNALFKSRLIDVLFNVSERIRSYGPGAAQGGGGSIDPIPARRVPPEAFAANLKALIERARNEGAKVILLTTAVHLPASARSPEVARLYDDGKAAWQRHDLAAAKKAFEAIHESDATESDALYYLSAIAASEGDRSRARTLFEAARSNESYRVQKDVQIYNEAARAVGLQMHVPVGDIDKWFGDRERGALFVDPIHFSREGNRLVAEGVRDIIARMHLLE